MDTHVEFKNALKATNRNLADWDAAMVVEEVATKLLHEKDAEISKLKTEIASLKNELDGLYEAAAGPDL